MKTGPHWGQVHGRLTMELRSGKIVDSRLVGEIGRDIEHSKLPTGKTDIVTFLLYSDDKWGHRPAKETIDPHGAKTTVQRPKH